MMIYIIILILLIILLYVFLTLNSFIRWNNKVNEAFATMDVYLKKRWDLIPNIVEIVKGYAKHEKDTLEKVIELRNGNYDGMANDEKIEKNTKLTQNITKLMALAESYPELKASENFRNLAKELTRVEDEIAQSRKYYNAVVRRFNNKIEVFPNSICAKLFNYQKKHMFEAQENERENIKVHL